MDIQTFLRVLGRRWWVVLPALLVVVGLTLGVANLVKPTYNATSTLVLYAPPNQDTTKAPTGPPNPLMGVSGLSDVTAVMVARMGDPDAVEAIGQTKGWTVANIDGSSAPLLIVTVDKNTPELALATVDKIDGVIEQQLVELQLTKGTAPDDLIHSKLLQKDRQASVVQGSRLRAMVATFMLGLILVTSLAFATEAIANSRSSRGPRRASRDKGARKKSRRKRRHEPVEPTEKQDQDPDESHVIAPVNIAATGGMSRGSRSHGQNI